LSRYDVRRPFAAWLRTITLNKCRDFGRRRSACRLFLARFEREQAPLTERIQADTPPDPQGKRLDRLEREIAALAPTYKEALLLTVSAASASRRPHTSSASRSRRSRCVSIAPGSG